MTKWPRFWLPLWMCFLATVTSGIAWLPSDSPRQQAESTGNNAVQIPGLKGRVTVHRDDRGIPHITAQSEADLFLAQGYITASDRLWQMDLLRRAARGELSEIFGKAALEEDKRVRRLGYAGLAEIQARNLAPPLRPAMEAYVSGVNAWIGSIGEKLPVEFRLLKYKPREWTIADSMLISKLLAEQLSTSWRTDLMRAALQDLSPDKRSQLLPDSSPMDVLVVGSDTVASPTAPPTRQQGHASAKPPTFRLPGSSIEMMNQLSAESAVAERFARRIGMFAEDLAASNNWVVNGSRSVTGKPLLANDPHLAPSVPSVWYLVNLMAPGFHAAGVAFPGAPGVILGHNENIAWGATNLGPDVQDVYLEHFDRDNPRRYRTPVGWAEAEVRKEEIKVRKNPSDPATESVELEITVTRNGPVIFERGEGSDLQRYALRWTMLDPKADPSAAFMGLNRARNWTEFCAALSAFPGPTQNFIYADVEGHIGYYGAGRIPTRRTGDGSLPYDGATAAGDWTAYIPFDRLPHVLDPASGVIVTANSRIVGRDYPYHLTHQWADPYRARRIRDLITAKPKLSAADIASIQGDVFSIAGKSFAAEILQIARKDIEARGAEAASSWADVPQLLEAWDGRFTPESKAALIVAEIRSVFRLRLLEGALGPQRARDFAWFSTGTFLDQIIQTKPSAWLPTGVSDYPSFLRACLAEAHANLAKRLGQDSSAWSLGNPSNGFRWWKHPMADAPFVGAQFKIPLFPVSGNGSNMATVNVGTPVSMRMIADPSDWDATRHGIALGESGDPASPHYKDQLEDWRSASPRVFPFGKSAVEKAAKSTVIFVP